jgi:hypothetical protein
MSYDWVDSMIGTTLFFLIAKKEFMLLMLLLCNNINICFQFYTKPIVFDEYNQYEYFDNDG